MRLLYVCLSILTSCGTNMGTGLISGTTLGASLGGISAGPCGGLIGSAAGLLAGGIVGAALDEQDRKIMNQSSPRTVERMDRDEPLTINDIIKLSQAGVSDDAIIAYISDRKTRYGLTQTQIRRLQDAGVSQKVINYMNRDSD